MVNKLPDGFQVADGIAWGSRMPGLFEIKYHNPKMKNAVSI